MGKMTAWLRQLTRDNEDADARQLASDVEASKACPASDCHQGEKVLLLGRLRSVDLSPSLGQPALHAELFDGSDAVHLVWLGRRSIRGIEPGRNLRAWGRVLERAGEKTIYNPEYELLPSG